MTRRELHRPAAAPVRGGVGILTAGRRPVFAGRSASVRCSASIRQRTASSRLSSWSSDLACPSRPSISERLAAEMPCENAFTAARESFREKHMSASPTMVDYLHLEMVRSLANDDADLLGPEYPGPLV